MSENHSDSVHKSKTQSVQQHHCTETHPGQLELGLQLGVELEKKLHETLEGYNLNLMNQYQQKEKDRLRMRTSDVDEDGRIQGQNQENANNHGHPHTHSYSRVAAPCRVNHHDLSKSISEDQTNFCDGKAETVPPDLTYFELGEGRIVNDANYTVSNGSRLNFKVHLSSVPPRLEGYNCNDLDFEFEDDTQDDTTLANCFGYSTISKDVSNHQNSQNLIKKLGKYNEHDGKIDLMDDHAQVQLDPASFNINMNRLHSAEVDISDSNSISDSQGSSSNAFAEPPSLGDVADDLSELSDMELTFDGPIEWPDAEILASNRKPLPAPLLENTAAKLLLYQADNTDLNSVDSHTQARLEALLEAAGIGKLSTTDGKAFADPEVLRKLTSSVSCALDEAAAALTRMRSEPQPNLPYEEKSLAKACSDGDVEAVKRLLKEGRSVNETSAEGESLLIMACSAGYYELTEVLLRMNAHVEDRGLKADCTPLMEAASGGYVRIVRLLLAYDADVNAQSSAGHTALHHAAVAGQDEVVQILIAANANVEEQNENGHTPLMEAASAGHVSVAQILLDAGAGINTHSSEFKESALTLACYKGHLDMVKFLLDAGADQEHKTDEMHTALMEASMDGHVEVARLLLDSGAQVNMPADSFESPLTLAACGGHNKLASLLIERGANLEEVNDEGYTPLMEASREGHEEMVILLLANHANVNTQTEETQETALTLACCGGFIDVAQYLITSNAELELGCSTPLMEASQEGHLELVKFLIEKGCNVNAQTGNHDSPLTYACENGHTDVADVLLHYGAELEHESEGGRTPLMKAARAGHYCTVQFLISKGANVNKSTANNEHTVLSLACAGGHLRVVELLLQYNADPLHKLKDGSTMLIEASKGGHLNVVNLLLLYPNNTQARISATVSSEYPDAIPMADNLPPDASDFTGPLDISQKATESLAGRLEQFIHKMMSQAENSSGTREEQMARKQEILEELQRVEHELKLRTQLAQESQHSLSSDALIDPLPPSTPGGSNSLHVSAAPQASYDSISVSPPSITPSHQFVEQALRQKQHEVQLQQQKEYYQAKLQLLKQQYQQKQLQLQHQRQQLLSQAASNGSGGSLSLTECDVAPNRRSSIEGEGNRQPIPLHIALQNHLHAHRVTEGNIDDLAEALQQWDTRDRNHVSLTSSLVKPMPSFNFNSKHEEMSAAAVDYAADLPLKMEELTLTETPPSRSLIDSVANLIQEKVKDEAQAKAMNMATECDELTMKTLQWLQSVDAQIAEEAAQASMNNGGAAGVTISTSETLSMGADITSVLNSYSPPPLAPMSSLDSIPLLDSNTLHQSVNTPSNQVSAHPQATLPAPTQRLSTVDPNAETDSNHDTALTLACAGGHAELVRILLAHNAHIEHRDKKGFTPLILAATAGHADVVDILLENNAEIEAQSERTKDTPLSLACSGGRKEVVTLLLKRQANKEHRNVSDYTPLSLAASGGYAEIIKVLLEYGAEINSRTGSKLGISPLMLAAMNGHTNAVELLLIRGSDINAQIETNRNTALTLACFQGRHEVVELLVGKKANIEHRAKTGLTPLMEAASGGYVEVGRVLLDAHADVNAAPVPSSKDTALTIAADKGHYKFVDLLLANGAAVDVKNKKGNSPLWLACNGGHLDVVQLLVSNNAEIDSQDNRKVTALMTAFRKGHVKVVKWLVRFVAQFPSDTECGRFISTVNDKDLLKKCQQCMSLIMQAKEQQRLESLKIASSLLEEIETEKSREEKRKEAAARKREKKKLKKKERQAEQLEKAAPEIPDDSKSERNSSSELVEPQPTATTNTSPAVAKRQQADGQAAPLVEQSIQKKENLTTSESTKKPVGKATKGDGKENMTKKNRRNKEKAVRKDNKSERKSGVDGVEQVPMSTTSTRITELDDFADLPLLPNAKTSGRHTGTKRDRTSSGINQLDSFDGGYTKYTSPSKPNAGKSALPSPGKKKREETGSDWKQVTNKKSKRVSAPAKTAVQGTKSLHSVREKTRGQLQMEKNDKKSTERSLAISGGEGDGNQQAKRTAHAHHAGVSSGSGGTTTATVTSSQTSASRDSMSSIGTFNLADYFPTSTQSQATGYTESKPKVTAHSKPGWPVRPSNANHSVWRHPTVATPPAHQSNMSPRSQPANTVRMPSAVGQVAVSVGNQPKQPFEVSRQLFPEGGKSSPLRAESLPDSTISAATNMNDTHRSPMLEKQHQSVPPAITQMTSPQLRSMQAAGRANMVVGNPLSQSTVQHVTPRSVETTLQSPKTSLPTYSPFDSQTIKPSPARLHAQSTDFINSADPKKAPGFRNPMASPQPTVTSYSSELAIGEEGFSRAPGARVIQAVDPLMSPRSLPAFPSNVHAHFTDSTTGRQFRIYQPPMYVATSIPADNQRNLTPAMRQHHYSTTGEPMTLPRMPSSLNPNASEFTAPSRFGGGDASRYLLQSDMALQSHQQVPVQSAQISHGSTAFHQQGMFRQMMAPPSNSQNSQGLTVVNQPTLTAVRGSYSPSNNTMTTPTQDVSSLSNSPSSAIDPSERIAIGGFFSQPAVFQPPGGSIWGADKTLSNDSDWGVTNTPPTDDNAFTLFNNEMGRSATATPPQLFMRSMPGAAGDNLQNAWSNNEPQSQQWPSWDKHKTEGQQ